MCVRNLNNKNRYIKYVAKFREIRTIFAFCTSSQDTFVWLEIVILAVERIM